MSNRELVGVEWINSREKRAMDIAYSIPASILLAPIGASALVLSRIMDGEGALFSHPRIGRQSTHFNVYKIRSLKDVPPDSAGTGTYEPHATALGRLIRPLGVDEIPQFLNIFRGEVSIVGPRAASPAVFETMQAILLRNEFDEWLEAYSLSKPGGISSAGIKNRTHNASPEELFRRKAELDILDFNNTSFRYDNGLIKQAGIVIARIALGRPYFHQLEQESLRETNLPF